MELLREINDVAEIPGLDEEAMRRCRDRWNNVAKPLNSLGLLEEAIAKMAGLSGDAWYTIEKRVVLVFCADNGVVCRGVTQTGSDVTAALARNLDNNDISVCKMAQVAAADVVPVDMGINDELELKRFRNCRLGAGTADLSVGPAMTREQAIRGIRHGIDLVGELKSQGYRIIATGEVGIGNTTTSSAMAAVLLDREPVEVTGRGAGLSSEGVKRKVAVIEQAIDINRPKPSDALDVLAKLGGFDIAGMTGVYLGGMLHRVPILVDGLISSVAALTAMRICDKANQAMLASHVSAEPAGRLLLDELGLKPLICAEMCLGEGTGAVAALPLLDMAYAVYKDMLTYAEISIEKYKPLA